MAVTKKLHFGAEFSGTLSEKIQCSHLFLIYNISQLFMGRGKFEYVGICNRPTKKAGPILTLLMIF